MRERERWIIRYGLAAIGLEGFEESSAIVNLNFVLASGRCCTSVPLGARKVHNAG